MIVKWSKAVFGDWTTASDWSAGVSPQAGDTVELSATGAPYTVTSSAGVTVAGLAIDSVATLDIAGDLNGDSFEVKSGGINRGTILVDTGSLGVWGGNLKIDQNFVNLGAIIVTSAPNSSLQQTASAAAIGLSTSTASSGSITADGQYNDVTLGEANGAALDTGVIAAIAEGTVYIDCNINGAVNGVTTGIISATNAYSKVYLGDGIRVSGENLTTSDGGYIVVGNNALTKVTVTFDGSNTTSGVEIGWGASVSVWRNSELDVTGALRNAGVIGLGPNATLNFLDGSATLTRSGEVKIGNEFRPATISYQSLTNDGLIDGEGTIGTRAASLTNNGSIDANVAEYVALGSFAPLTILGGVSNTGTIEATNGGALVFDGSLSQSTTGVIAAHDVASTVDVHGALAGGKAIVDGYGSKLELGSNADVHVQFGVHAFLQLDNSVGFSGDISGFAPTVSPPPAASLYINLGDTIDARDIDFAKLTAPTFKENAAGNGGTLTLSDGTHTANIALLGQFAASFTAGTPSSGYTGFALSDDGSAFHGTNVNYVTPPSH